MLFPPRGRGWARPKRSWRTTASSVQSTSAIAPKALYFPDSDGRFLPETPGQARAIISVDLRRLLQAHSLAYGCPIRDPRELRNPARLPDLGTRTNLGAVVDADGVPDLRGVANLRELPDERIRVDGSGSADLGVGDDSRPLPNPHAFPELHVLLNYRVGSGLAVGAGYRQRVNKRSLGNAAAPLLSRGSRWRLAAARATFARCPRSDLQLCSSELT